MTDLTEQWVNIYKSKKLGGYWSGAFCYKTKKEAAKDLADKEHYLTTVNIEDMLNLQAENTKLKTDCKTLAQKLLQVKPELRDWLEVNFKEYL